MLAVGTNVPVPELVQVAEPVEVVPLSVTVALFAQTVASLPAATVGGGVKKIVMLSSSGLQVPFAPEVRISVTFPPAISPAVGTYVFVSAVAADEKLPVPKVDQVPLPVELVPLMAAFGLFMQIEILAPAFTSGAFEMVKTIVLDTARQSPFPVVVSTIATLPAAVSAALGV